MRRANALLVDKEVMETFIYNSLIDYGFAPSREEVEGVANIFIELLFEMGVAAEEDDTDEFRRF